MSEHTRTGAVLVVVLVAVTAAVGGAAAVPVDGPASADGTAETVTLTVSVVDQGGNPLGGAEISATWDGGGPRNATTKGNGKAFVDVPAGVDVTVRVDRRFYVRNEPYVVENASAREVTVQMAREGQATVTVRDAGGPVGDAIVRLFQDGQPVLSGRTAADGTFTTPAIEQDDYTLVAFREGYLRNQTTLTVDGTVRETMTIEQDSVLVTFQVRDDHFSPPQPVVDANVTVGDIADVTTQGNGRVTVSIPVNDQYDVEITKPGYGSKTRTLDVRESELSLNATIRRIPSVSVETGTQRVVVGENVSVRVTDEYGDRVAGATVLLDGTEVGETNEEGVAEVTIETAGDHTIRVERGQRVARSTVEGVQPAPDETPTPTPTPTPSPTPTPTPTPPPTSGVGPGFGIVAGLGAVLVLALLARRRSRR